MMKNLKWNYCSLKYKVSNFVEKYSPIYINSLNFLKLVKHWWKSREAFKFPCIEIRFGKIENVPGFPWWYENNRMCNKLFGLYIFDLGYKWKWDEPRFESIPQIDLILCYKWKLYVGFRAPVETERKHKDKEGNITTKLDRNDMIYYEGILDYLYTCNKDIVKTYNNHCWVAEWDIETCSRETVGPHLKNWAKIICYEQDLPKLYKDYVKTKLELKELKSQISHSGSNSNNLSSGTNSEPHNNLSSGIDRKVNDLS